MRRRWLKSEDDLIKLSYTEETYREIANKLNRTEISVRMRVYRLRLPVRNYENRTLGDVTRRCSACKEFKNIQEFYKSIQTKDGLTPRCRKCMNRATVRSHSKNWQVLKIETFNAYGGVLCKCCGETLIEFLTLDHIEGNGKEHRRQLGNCYQLYSSLKKNGFPLGFQVLCYNCNIAKFKCGCCPHVVKKLSLSVSTG